MKIRYNPLYIAGLAAVLTTTTHAADRVKANNTSNLNLAASWVDNAVPGSGDVAVWNNTVTGTQTVALGADLSWGGIRMDNPGTAGTSGSVTISAGNTLTIGSSGIQSPDTLAFTANLTVAAPVVFGTTQSWNFNTSRAAILSGGVNAGGFSFTKTGAGTVVFSGTSTNLPSVIVNGGVFRATDGTGLPTSASLKLDGGVFESTGATFQRPLGTGGGQVEFSGNSGLSALGTAVSATLGATPDTLVWGSTASFNPTTLILNNGGANNTLTLQNPLDLGGADRTIDVRASTAVLPGVVSGTGSLAKTGGGALVLNGQNTFTGNVSVSAGALRASDGFGLPSSAALSLTGALLESNGTFTRALGTGAGQVRFTGAGTGIGAVGGTLTVNIGNNGQSLQWGSTDFNPGTGTLVLNSYSSGSAMQLVNGIDLGGAIRTIDVRNNTVTISGVISGAGGFTVNGSSNSTTGNAILALDAVNTFQGKLVVANTSGGNGTGTGGRNRIAVTRDENLGAVPTAPYPDQISMAMGGVLQASESFTMNANRYLGIGGSAGSGGVPVAGTISVLLNKHLTVPGVIADRTGTAANIGQLYKLDGGSLLLTNENNTFTGGLVINGGNVGVTSITNGGFPSSIGAATGDAANLKLDGGRLQYFGDGDTTDRLFSLTNSTAALDSSGSGPLAFSNTGILPVTGAGTRNINLTGSNGGDNIIAGSLANSASAPVSTTADWTAAGATITAASATGIVNGMLVTGAGFPAGTVVTGVNTTTRVVTLSANVAGTGSAVPVTFTNVTTINKNGTGKWILSGHNTFTGTIRLNAGGPLVFDFSGDNNTATPLSSAFLMNQGNIAEIKGRTTGSTSASTAVYQFGDNHYAHAVLRLTKGTGSGITMNIGTFNGSTATQRHDLFDLSSGTGNSITVGALGTNIAVSNGVVMNNTSIITNGRAGFVLRDTDGSYGFLALSGGTSGTVQKASTTPITPGTGLTINSNVTNYSLGAGDYTAAGDVALQTMAFDASAGAINFTFPGKFNTSGTGKAALFSGGNNVTITGPKAAADTGDTSGPIWFHNYLTGNAVLTVDASFNSGQTHMFGGPGFSIYNGRLFGNNLVINGGTTRLTYARDLNASTFTTPLRLGGGVFEIGADFNGDAAGDLNRAISDTSAGNFRLYGDSGFSAWTPTAGGTRVANFGPDLPLTWGTAFFLTNVDGTSDGDYALRLGSSHANATIEIQNAIALNNRSRTLQVADGVNAATDNDAVLSGVISGPGVGIRKTGAGILSLTGVNTYTGETHVLEGVLRVNGTSLAAASRLRVETGSRLEVSGTVYVSSAVIGGVAQGPGPVSSPLVTGNLVVGAPPVSGSPYELWVDANNIPEDLDAPDQDADGDGLRNLVEYAVGTDPVVANGSVVTRNPSGTISFRRATGRTDITAYLESSADLGEGSWTPIATSTAGGAYTSSLMGIIIVSETSAGSGLMNVTVTDLSAPAPEKKFYRVRAVYNTAP